MPMTQTKTSPINFESTKMESRHFIIKKTSVALDYKTPVSQHKWT